MGECLCEFESRSGHHQGEARRFATAAERENVLPLLFWGRAPSVPGIPETDVGDNASGVRWTYKTLLGEFGPQEGWWPRGGPFETMTGAVLTQNTAWRNAERALELLREAGALSHSAVLKLPIERLEELVRPCGSWRRKARTLAAIARTIDRHEGGLPGLLGQDVDALRETLLAVRGIGPETADAILLYAAGHPVFVVDAYARRYLTRHGICDARASYEQVKGLFESALGLDAAVLAGCHALLVTLGKSFCRVSPVCDECPLRNDLPGPELRSSRTPASA